jgi:cyclopropane fatty-acyl-phospholipid synthase-like methyltransferase
MTQLNPWHERFFDGLYGQVLPATFTEAQTRKQLAIVRRLLRLRRGHRVLDIPCGMGRLTIPLARSGLKMTGVELSDSYVRRARRAARGRGPAIRFVKADMRCIDFGGEFDAAFNWFAASATSQTPTTCALPNEYWRRCDPADAFSWRD